MSARTPMPASAPRTRGCAGDQRAQRGTTGGAPAPWLGHLLILVADCLLFAERSPHPTHVRETPGPGPQLPLTRRTLSRSSAGRPLCARKSEIQHTFPGLVSFSRDCKRQSLHLLLGKLLGPLRSTPTSSLDRGNPGRPSSGTGLGNRRETQVQGAVRMNLKMA